MLISSTATSGAIEAQVVIVGAGPAGMALALDLAGRGIDVALISSGSFGRDQTSGDLSQAQSLPAHHADPAKLNARRLGGLSWGWGGRCLPLDTLDFEPRPALDLPGWPIRRGDLMQHAQSAADFLGLGPPEFESSDTLPGVQLSLERWAAVPSLAEKHRQALSAEKGPHVYMDMNCTGAMIDENGQITALEAMTVDNRQVRFTGSTFVLAAGGLETARLLLWFFDQNGRTAPKWTGCGYMGHLKTQISQIKASDDVIQQLDYRRTPNCYVRNRLGLPGDRLIDDGMPNINFWLDNPYMSDGSHGVPGLSLAYLALSLPGLGPLLLPAALRDYFTGQSKPQLGVHLRNVGRNPFDAVSFCYSVWKGRRSHPVNPGQVVRPRDGWHRLSCAAEERPRFQNCVTLGESRDRHAVPRAVIRRDLHPDDIQGVIAANIALNEALSALERIEARLEGPKDKLYDKIVASSGDGYHQIGTARMGSDPSESVTDPDCRVHGVRNLYVTGSAVFPRSGQANPTFSIVCLSARLAEHIARNLT